MLAAGCVVVVLIAWWLPRVQGPPQPNPAQAGKATGERSRGPEALGLRQRHQGFSDVGASESAEQFVARKASQFAHAQREVFAGMAKQHKVSMPAEVERFFAAAESGNWEELKAAFEALRALRQSPSPPPQLSQLWGPILATFNALEEVHRWPAQQYLDYGNAILGSLRPGMAYVGGTDAGRGIPELLNATSEGERHVVITQNGLADGAYLDYLRYLYGDQLNLPTPEDSQQAFADYLADAQKRYLHDQQFPDEPPQLKPGENISMSEGKVTVSGQVAVMGVNELILQDILKKNPTLAFGLEESFPLKSTYGDAGLLGPITEVRAADGPNAVTAETAGQSLAYWQDTVQQILADPAAANAPQCLGAYAKLVDAQANLFVSHGLSEQAEQAFRLSLQLWPGSPDAAAGYVDLLQGEHRSQEALAVAQSAAQAAPENKPLQELLRHLQGPARAAGGGAGLSRP